MQDENLFGCFGGKVWQVSISAKKLKLPLRKVRSTIDKDKLGCKSIGRKIVSTGDVYQLKETKTSYSIHFDGKTNDLRLKNYLYWDGYSEKSA